MKKDKGCTVHHLSKRDSELNQKLSPPLFWLVLALCYYVPGWVGFGLNKWKKLQQIREEAVCPSSKTEVKKEKRSRRIKITLPVSIALDCWPHSTKNFFSSLFPSSWLTAFFTVGFSFTNFSDEKWRKIFLKINLLLNATHTHILKK